MTDTYTCAACNGEFEKGWLDEDAAAQFEETFALPQDECALVCDDCYQAMMGRYQEAMLNPAGSC